MMLLRPNLAANAIVVCKLCSLLITILTYQTSLNTYMKILNNIFDSY